MSGSNSNLTVAQPLPSSPIVDLSTGNLTSPWLNFLSSLYARTGSGPGPGEPAQDTTQTALIGVLDEGTDSDGIDAKSAANAAVLAALGDVVDSPIPADPAQSLLLDDVQDVPGDPMLASIWDDPSDDALAPFNGAWSATAGVVTAASGTLTATGNFIRYKKVSRIVLISVEINITTNGTGAGGINITLPFVCNSVTFGVITGREMAISGKGITGSINPSGSTLAIANYDNTYPGGTGAVLVLSGVYESST